MRNKPCRKLEKECEEAREKWQTALRKDIGGLPLVKEPLGHETPPASGSISTKTHNLRHRYEELAARLRKCYEKHGIPEKERLWARKLRSESDHPESL